MSEDVMYEEYVLERAKNILLETMKTSWPQSTVAERKLAIYAAEYEVRAEQAEAAVRGQVEADACFF